MVKFTKLLTKLNSPLILIISGLIHKEREKERRMIIKRENIIEGPIRTFHDEDNVKVSSYAEKVSNILNKEQVFLNSLINEIPNDTREQRIVRRLLNMIKDIAEIRA